MLRKRNALVVFTLLSLMFATSGALAAEADAAKIFKSKCKMCHGDNGDGKTAMGEKLGAKDLGSAEVQAKSDEELIATITDGKDKMPKWGEKLSAEEIQALVGFIRGLVKTE